MSRTDHADTVADIREKVEDLSANVAWWGARNEDPAVAEPRVRQAGGEAVEAIDSLLRKLHTLRSGLVGEIRQHSDAFMAALDEQYGPAK